MDIPPCPTCKGPRELRRIPCPDGKEGCAVKHSRAHCPKCALVLAFLEVHEWLASQGRRRFTAGDNAPPDVLAQATTLVREHRATLGVPIVGLWLTAADYNAALDWGDAGNAEP